MGVGASKFLGVRRILAQISVNLPENSPKKITSKKKNKTTAFHWAHFFKSRHFKHHFCHILTQTCPQFLLTCPKGTKLQHALEKIHTLCPNFHRSCPDFHQIERFGGAVATPARRLLDQCAIALSIVTTSYE